MYLKCYINILIKRDLNSEISENRSNGFYDINSLKTPNRGTTCFKNPNDPSPIDLFLTNRQQCFQQIHTNKMGVSSDFHKMIVTVTKNHYKKQKSFNTNITNILMNNLLILIIST